MSSLQRLHPVSLGVHLLSVIAVAMFVRQPVILCIALAGGAAYLAIPEPHACGLSTGRLLGWGILLCVGSGNTIGRLPLAKIPKNRRREVYAP